MWTKDSSFGWQKSVIFACVLGILATVPLEAGARQISCLVHVPVDHRDGGYVVDTTVLSTGRVLVHTSTSHLFELDKSQARLVSVPAAVSDNVWEVKRLDDGGYALIGTKNGLFRMNPETGDVRAIGTEGAVGAVNKILTLTDGRTLVGADGGLFQLTPDGKNVNLLLPYKSTHGIHDIAELTDHRIVVASSRGVFRLSPGADLEATITNDMAVELRDLHDGWLGVATEGNMPLLSPEGSRLIKSPNRSAFVGTNFIALNRQRALVLNDDSTAAFIVSDEPSSPVQVSMKKAAVTGQLLRLDDGAVLYNSGFELFDMSVGSTELRRIAGSPCCPIELPFFTWGEKRVLVEAADETVTALGPDGTPHRIGFDRPLTKDVWNSSSVSLGDGAFLFSQSETFLLEPNETTFRFLNRWRASGFGNVTADGTRRAFEESNGVAVIDLDNKKLLQELPRERIGGSSNINVLGDFGILVSGDKGAFLLSPGSDTFVAVATQLTTVGMKYSVKVLPGPTLVSSTTGGDIYFLATEDSKNAAVEFDPAQPLAETPAIITARVSKSMCASQIALWHPHLQISGTSKPIWPIADSDGTLTFSHEFPTAGGYTMQLTLDGSDAFVGGEKTIFAGSTAQLWAYRGVYTSIVGFFGYFVLGVALMFLARFNSVLFDVLFEWDLAVAWRNRALKLRWVQLWILARYAESARSATVETAGKPYAPLPVTKAAGESLVADTSLFNELKKHKHIWIQGNPGMGKSTLVDYLERQYFRADESDASVSTRSLWKKWGMLSVFLKAQEAELGMDKDVTSRLWLSSAALGKLTAFGFDFKDPKLIQSLMASGTFAVVLDAVNEVGREDELQAFALGFPKAYILVTSQSDCRPPFVEYRLPGDIKANVEGLLKAHLGTAKGGALYQLLIEHHVELLQSLRSGYDVQLIIDLFLNQDETGRMPTNRAGLYAAILADAQAPIERLGELAWKMMLESRRRISSTDTDYESLIQPLENTKRNLLRRLSGEALEFTHDLMRTYLAASWLVRQARNPESLFHRLDDKRVWDMSEEDKGALWQFLSALLSAEILPPLWGFAVADPVRVGLQHALQDEALRRGLRLFDVESGEI
jgi:hypothetical protein